MPKKGFTFPRKTIPLDHYDKNSLRSRFLLSKEIAANIRWKNKYLSDPDAVS